MFLAIDTSTRYAGVALADARRVVSCRCWFSTVNHTVELMPAVAQTLQGAGLGARDLEGIAVALGPGGFSSLRVGLSVAKGLALSARIPLVGLGSLDLEAFPYLASGLAVCAMLDVGRSEVAWACFGPDGRRRKEDTISSPRQLLDCVAEPTLFCGEGVSAWAELFKERLGGLVVAHPVPAVRLWSLVEMGRRRLAAGEVCDLATLQPYYLLMPSIGSAKRRDWAPQSS